MSYTSFLAWVFIKHQKVNGMSMADRKRYSNIGNSVAVQQKFIVCKFEHLQPTSRTNFATANTAVTPDLGTSLALLVFDAAQIRLSLPIFRRSSFAKVPNLEQFLFALPFILPPYILQQLIPFSPLR